ncbi:MAG: hypothetical protein JRS35_01480 [Deltaproteobacteria bacterium]|nr:hypothetical protein [Deltaproteobacteria bacterium]
MKSLLVVISICFFSAVAMGAGGKIQWGAPEESPNLEEHARTITACEDGGVPYVTCTVDVQNMQECIVGCAYPVDESEDE